MKSIIILKNRTLNERITNFLKNLLFSVYSFLQTIFSNPKQLGKVFWSISDCYIIIGKSGYISKGKIYDINGDVTILNELIINTTKPIEIKLSEPEFLKIKKLAEEKHITIKDTLMLGIDKLIKNEIKK